MPRAYYRRPEMPLYYTAINRKIGRRVRNSGWIRHSLTGAAALLAVWALLLGLHATLLHLPYFWDEAGYYVPAALDFYRHGLLIPVSTVPTGHTPLVMVYLALAWHVFGFSEPVTRAAMILLAAATLLLTLNVARYVFEGRDWGREGAIVSAGLLALAPLYFAQSSMAHLDLTVALFTAWAILEMLRRRWVVFGAAATLAVLSKETAVIMAPVAAVFAWIEARREGRRVAPAAWAAIASPCAALAGWALYYHHHTGFWTGNETYLQYNLYSTLNPVRMVLSFVRRLYEVFVSGCSGVVTLMALGAAWWSRKRAKATGTEWTAEERRFMLLTAILSAAYLAMLSVVGGAILPRYTLPIYPPLVVLAVLYIYRLPRPMARAGCAAAAVLLVTAWFRNPPYPFPFEDNLAYADFVRLHQQAASYLSAASSRLARTGHDVRILTAWPATNELSTPDLGYVRAPLNVVGVEGFGATHFKSVQPGSFDLLYLYSRKWEPPGNWLLRLARLEAIEERYFGYQPQASAAELQARFHLRLLKRWESRGQWAAIYGPAAP
jgi:Dolichyl-phosphate-mannose-protein mannosyltransferase